MIYKLDNITNLTAARWAAAEGFDYISFNFDKASINYINPMLAAEICKWVTGIKFIGSFSESDIHIILDIYNLLGLDGIEIDYKSDFLSTNKEIKAIVNVDFNSVLEAIEFKNANKNIIALSINSYRNLPDNFPLESCFIPTNLRLEAINRVPYGISINSANESEAGIIDFEVLENSIDYWRNNYNRT